MDLLSKQALPIKDRATALQILTMADQLESLFLDEGAHLSEKGLAYLIIYHDEQARLLFLQLLKETNNPVAKAYALLGLYQHDKEAFAQLDKYQLDTSLAVNLKLNSSLFVGMRLADVIHEIQQDELHQHVVWGQEKLFV